MLIFASDAEFNWIKLKFQYINPKYIVIEKIDSLVTQSRLNIYEVQLELGRGGDTRLQYPHYWFLCSITGQLYIEVYRFQLAAEKSSLW